MKAMKIAFIGAGNMAEAILKGLIKREIFLPEDILCNDINYDRLDYLKDNYGIDINESHIKEADIFVLAVKPQHIKEALVTVKKYFSSSKLIVSIMAGITISKIEQLFNCSKPLQIVRSMPNTPALFERGAIAYSFNDNVSMSYRESVSIILSAIGLAVEVTEDKLDAITALSGSGPAYFFYLTESMIKAGIALGLDEELARILAVQTAYGAGYMLKNSQDSPGLLREKVTSKGGTTEAALKCFDKKDVKGIVNAALLDAKNRSLELSS